MKPFFRPEARADVRAAFDYYEQQEAGLGSRFAADLAGAIDSILSLPRAWTPVAPNLRRRNLRRFPYGVLYRILDEHRIEIVVVMDLRRRPNYWRDRLRR